MLIMLINTTVKAGYLFLDFLSLNRANSSRSTEVNVVCWKI